MSFCASFFWLLIFLFYLSSAFSLLLPSPPTQNPNYINQSCPNTSITYSRNSTYFTNLKTLLSSLSSPNASYSTGFQTATTGQDPDRVTGLFLCRGDVSQEVCRNCVTFSINQTLERCLYKREVVQYYDECMLRYSHRNILSIVTDNGNVILLRDQNQADLQFRDLVSSTLKQAALEAANSSRKFYTRKVTTPQTLYVLLQCTPDLTRQECLHCLQKSINGMLLDRIGGRHLYPSCNSRYELYSFYNETATRTSPPPPISIHGV